jgi:ATP-dependent RNA helicase DDX27
VVDETEEQDGENEDEDNDEIENNGEDSDNDTEQAENEEDLPEDQIAPVKSRSSHDDDEELEQDYDHSFFTEMAPTVETKSTFNEMTLSRPLLKAVNDLGYEHPTPIQARTIPILLQ